MQNVPENSAKTSLPWWHFKTDHALRREENNRKQGWIPRRTISWWKASLPPQKESWAFFWTFSFHFLSFNGVSLSLKCRTLVLKHLHGDRAAAICWKLISVTKVSKYGKSEYSQALNASYTFQPSYEFLPKLIEICMETPCWCSPGWAPTLVADGNQQKHLLPSFAKKAWIYSSRNSWTLKEYFFWYMNCLDSKMSWNKSCF